MLDTRGAAAVLGLKPDTVKQHITAGNIKAVKLAGRYIIEETEVERFKKNRRKAGRQFGSKNKTKKEVSE